MLYLYVDQISPSVTSLGPGKRIALWVQGCSLRCFDCMSAELFERQVNSRVKVSDITKKIISYAPGHAGVTISGGEPFEQAEALTELLLHLRENTSLDIMIYSGYRQEEILKNSAAMLKLLSLTDILVDGRYRSDLPTNKPWCGSDNQVVYLLSNRAQAYGRLIKGEFKVAPRLQVEITAEKEVSVIGIPRRGELGRLKIELMKKGIVLKK